MQKYYYKIYSDTLLTDWNAVISKSGDSWAYHDMNLCGFLARDLKAQNYSLIFYNSNSNEPAAICPLFIYPRKSNRMFFADKKIAESFYASGIAIINELSNKKRREIIQYIGSVLEEVFRKENVDTCKISSADLCEYCLTPEHSYTNPWHELRGAWQNEPTAYYYLDLKNDEALLSSKLETRARTIIHAFEKDTSCTIKKASPADADTVYKLFSETSGRAKLSHHSIDNFLWWLNFEYSLHYIAFINEVPACVIRLIKYKNGATYSAGFTANSFVKSDVNTYLLWFCILKMKEEGILHFDLGNEEFKPIGSKWDNIAKFKRSFGGELRYKFSSVYERETFAKRLLRKIADKL